MTQKCLEGFGRNPLVIGVSAKSGLSNPKDYEELPEDNFPQFSKKVYQNYIGIFRP